MNKNIIAIQNRQSVLVNTRRTARVTTSQLLALQADIAQLGYTLDGPALAALHNCTDIATFHAELVSTLRETVGAHVKYRTLFKNFPNDVPNVDEYDINRFWGIVENVFPELSSDDGVFLTCGHFVNASFDLDDFGACPICQCQVPELIDEEDLPSSDDVTCFKVLKLATESDVDQIFINLLMAKTSISDNDRTIIDWYVRSEGNDIIHLIPDSIPMKENLAYLTAKLLEYTDVASFVSKHIKTSTDVLRIAAQLSGGDVTLSTNTRFKLSRPQRRLVVELLDGIFQPEIDMKNRREQWLKLGQVLHIGSMAEQYPSAYAAFDVLRNAPEEIITFNRKVEDLIYQKQFNKLPALLESRPGVFARRLDFMLSNVSRVSDVIGRFKLIVGEIPTPLLLTVRSHLTNRIQINDVRTFLPKGKVSKLKVVADDRPVLDENAVNKINKIIESELTQRFSRLPKLGRVYIDPVLEKMLVPFSQRSASRALQQLVRGSRISFGNAKHIRPFLYWKQTPYNRIDVDLSVVFYTDDWKNAGHVSYTNLSEMGVKHSGDIQSAPHGAAEFIDINLDQFRKHNYECRYIVINVISYTGQAFNSDEFAQAFSGIMFSDRPINKKIDPAKVVNKFDVTSETTYSIPLVIDLYTNEMIWADTSLNQNMRRSNVEGASKGITAYLKSITTFADSRPTLMQLFKLHCAGRATQVDYVKVPNVKYDLELDQTTATNVDEILGSWLV